MGKNEVKTSETKTNEIKNKDTKSVEDTKTNECFWNATIDEVKKGYVKEGNTIRCLICDDAFQVGRVYKIGEEFYEAWKAAEIHIEKKHSSMLSYLLKMNGTFTGVSEIQRELLKQFAEGISDKEIASRLGVATSTIRNHRYKLREKEKQAKLYLAMMELLSENTNKKINKLDSGIICDAHKTATTVDDRFNITNEEKLKIISNYIDENGALKNYPSKEKKKIIVLEEIMKIFTKDKIYTEKEINRILSRIYEDYATLRRALIEYGFLNRANDCSSYWVKE